MKKFLIMAIFIFHIFIPQDGNANLRVKLYEGKKFEFRTKFTTVSEDVNFITLQSQIASNLYSTGVFIQNDSQSNTEIEIQLTPNQIDEAILEIALKVTDTVTQAVLTNKLYKIQTNRVNNIYEIANIVSDDIYQSVTGYEGYFHSFIIFVNEKLGKSLARISPNGKNFIQITQGKSLNIVPKISRDNQKILYVSYLGDTPRLYIRDIQNNSGGLLVNKELMSFGGAFAADNERIAFTVAGQDINIDLYEINLKTKTPQRLTNRDTLDVSPSYSPDGSMIVFSSNRSGRNQNLYVMNLKNKNISRITFEKGDYQDPAWSHDGKKIAFTRIKNGKFGIGVIDLMNKKIQIHTQNRYVDEYPNWSPDSSAIVFARQTQSKNSIYTVNLLSNKLTQIFEHGSDPDWSNRLNIQ